MSDSVTAAPGRMRILLIVEPGIDGVFRHVESLAHFLLGQQQEVHLAYSSRRGSESLGKLVAAIQSRGGECLDLKVGNAPEPGDGHALWRLRAFAKRLHPDVIHAHSSKAGVLGRSLKLLGVDAGYFYSPHAYYGLAPRSGYAVHFYNFVERVFGRVGTTINISKDEADFGRRVLRIAPSRVRTIHNPVDASVFKPVDEKAKADCRRKLGLPETAVVLGTIGRLSFQKDPQTLYRALAPALRQRSDLVLCHVGQGELEGTLHSLAEELGIAGQIVRPLYLNEPAVFYQAIDGLIMTSRYEAGWPIAVLEALAAGLPLVVSEAPGTSDIAAAGLSHCWTARSGDVGGFTKAIESWLGDRARPRACNHRQVAIERFSPEKAYGAILAEYRRAN